MLNAAFLADEHMKPINPGDNVYIYEVSALTGYSVDFDESIFHSVRTHMDNDRIYIGRLKDKLSPGLVSTITLNTQSGSEEMKLTLCPEFLSIMIDNKLPSAQDHITGNVVFASNGRTSGAGIDSMFIITEGEADSAGIYRIFHTDTIVDYDYTNGIFAFDLEPVNRAGNFAMSVVMFSGELSDTVYYADGFSTEQPDYYGRLMFIVDTRSSIMYEKLRSEYSFSEAVFYSTFYRGADRSLLDNDFDMICIVSIDGGYMMNNYEGLLNIIQAADEKPVFVFAPGLRRILSYEENAEDMDSITAKLKIRFAENGNDDFLGFKPMEGFEISYADNDESGPLPYIQKGNLHLFLFLPESIEYSDLDRISKNTEASMEYSLLGSFSVIDTVICSEYGNFSIDLIDASGRFVRTVDLGTLPFGQNILNISELVSQSGEINSGQYFYTLKRSGTCLKSGSVIIVR